MSPYLKEVALCDVAPELWKANAPDVENVPQGPVDSNSGQTTVVETSDSSVPRVAGRDALPAVVEQPEKRGRGRPRNHDPKVHPDAGISRHLLKRVPDALGRLQP